MLVASISSARAVTSEYHIKWKDVGFLYRTSKLTDRLGCRPWWVSGLGYKGRVRAWGCGRDGGVGLIAIRV